MEFPAIVVFLCIALLYLKIIAMATTSAAIGDVGGSERDHIALLAFKSKIKYDPQGAMSSWNNSRHLCEWQGVTCGRRHRRVTILDLRSRGLVGTLSPYIGNLSFLKEMRLGNNTLQGKIPPEIGRLFRLESLRLPNNSLEGEIPANIFHCSNLVILSLGNNKFVGKIPEELGALSKLEVLSIIDNNLTGGILPWIGNLTSLKELLARYNKFGGSIPDVFHRLKSLSKLGLGGNELYGTIPPSIYNLSHLTIFSFSENQLQGSLPLNFGLFFPHLKYLQTRNNNFTGPIPYSLSNVSELESIEIDYNNFSGKLTIDFSSMEHLSWMSMISNNLGTGDSDDMKFLTSLLNCSSLEIIQLSDNHFGGPLPNSVANLSTRLRFLQIHDNQISGYIPTWIGSLTNLAYLAMGNNKLIGPIPEALGKLQNLYRIDLEGNMLSGKIPNSLGNLSSLTRLSLHRNRLEGTIPSSIGKSKSLFGLVLHQNSLGGTIPKQLFNISTLVALFLNQNQFAGFLPSEVGNLKNIEVLSVFENKLFGQIPNNLGRCNSLETLYMQGNSFSGSIPPTLSSLRGIQQLDLSRNNLTGEIPDYLETFSLTYLNLSFNDFEGEIPTKGVFTNATTFSVLGNKRLCGGILELKLPSCYTKESKKRNISSLAVVLIITACVILGVSLVLAFMYFKFKNKRKEQPSGSVKTLMKVSYAMLLNATDGFSTANLIGVGSFGTIYKGILDQDEQIVAIKVLKLQRRGASKSFMTECEALRNIRHRNLLKIITSCSSVNFQGNEFKALVYEFMPNGSLDTWLHPILESSINHDWVQKLNLLQRINICIDVACALEYLHCHCQPPILHCDLKPSNILLDSDMIAHVGDFGLAKLVQEFTTPCQSSSMGIRGTIGYAAPEYGLGSEVSKSGDIYSFGIVLLEMMTGKRPTDDVFKDGHNLHKFAMMALPDRLMEIVDPIFLSNEGEAASNNTRSVSQVSYGNTRETLISLVRIGVVCPLESPHDRMDITSAVRELHLARGVLQPESIRHQR